MRVDHAGESIGLVIHSLAEGRHSPANSARSRELPANHWRSGPRISSKRASRPSLRSWKTRHPNIRNRSWNRRACHPRPPSSQRERGKGVMLPVCAYFFTCFYNLPSRPEAVDDLGPMVTGLRDEVNREVSELCNEFIRERSQFHAEIASEMAQFRDEVRNEIAQLRAEIAGEMSQLRTEVRNGHAQLGTHFAELHSASANHNSMLMLLCQQDRLPVPSLNFRLPSAPPMEEQAASTPSALSAISNISSTSSVPHFGSLTIDSPTAHAATSLPVAGPSGVNRDHAPIQGMSTALVVVITEFNTPDSTRRNPSHRVRSRTYCFKTSIQGSFESSERRRISGRLARACLILNTLPVSCTITPGLCR